MLLSRRDRSVPGVAHRRLRQVLPPSPPPAGPAPSSHLLPASAEPPAVVEPPGIVESSGPAGPLETADPDTDPPVPVRPPSTEPVGDPPPGAVPTGSPSTLTSPPVTGVRSAVPPTSTRVVEAAVGMADDRAEDATPRAIAPPAGERGGDSWRTQATRLLGLRHALLDPGRRGLRALVVVALLAVVVAGVVAWRLRPVTEPVAAPVAPSAPEPSPTGSAGRELVVAVAGKVRRPGLVRLPAGSRVADAIHAAGGPLPGTDLGLLNLARKLVDGEQILVGVTPPPAATGAGTGGAAAPGAKINLNTASAAELDTLPGIGPALAQRILTYRTEHGGFRSIDELKQVSGIGDARFADLKDLVTV